MQLLQDGLIAMLAAIGLASLMWAVVRTALFAGEPHRRAVLAVIPAQGDGAALEGQVRALEQLRLEQGLLGRVLLVDCGLNDEGRRLAQLLAKKDRWVAFCQREEISQYIGTERTM